MCGMILAPSHYPHSLVMEALKSMDYRGDGRAPQVSLVGDWHMGHVRLAIQDMTSASDQPFRAYGIRGVFVGEILNHPEDMTELDYIVKVYRASGLAGFHEFDGFWSMALATEYNVQVVTDHLSIKPLYHWVEKNIYCSEIEPMFHLAPRPHFDQVYLSNCVKFGYDYSGRTPYEGIRQLAPGTVHTLQLTQARAAPRESVYWDWGKVSFNPSLRGAVTTAILNRLVGDRPVGLLLSGGLDSSIIYHVLRQHGREVQTFSVENGESQFLPEETEVLAVNPVTIQEALKYMQAPLDLGSLLPQVQLAKAVGRQGLHVCLTGDGADEVFGGYSRAQVYDSQASDIFCELPYYHLPRLDRVMMRETVEVRSPFLSPQVVALGLTIRREARTCKQALKSAFEGIVPGPILARAKHPLKSKEVLEGGLHHRRQLVEEFQK